MHIRAHAEARVGRRIDRGDAHEVGARDRVGAARDLANPAGEDAARVGPERDTHRLPDLEALELALGRVDDDFLLAGACELEHRLAGGDDLAGFGGDGNDDAVRVGDERRVARLVRGEGGLGAHLLEAALGRVVRVLLPLERGGAHEFLREQVLVAHELGLRERVVAFGGGELPARGARGKPRIFRIEAREHLALLHRGARVGEPRRELPAHAEADIGLVARANFAGIDVAALRSARLHLHGQHRADRLLRGLRFAARGERDRQQREDEASHVFFLFGGCARTAGAAWRASVPLHSARSASSTSRS